jgi:hypothetical protein
MLGRTSLESSYYVVPEPHAERRAARREEQGARRASSFRDALGRGQGAQALEADSEPLVRSLRDEIAVLREVNQSLTLRVADLERVAADYENLVRGVAAFRSELERVRHDPQLRASIQASIMRSALHRSAYQAGGEGSVLLGGSGGDRSRGDGDGAARPTRDLEPIVAGMAASSAARASAARPPFQARRPTTVEETCRQYAEENRRLQGENQTLRTELSRAKARWDLLVQRALAKRKAHQAALEKVAEDREEPPPAAASSRGPAAPAALPADRRGALSPSSASSSSAASASSSSPSSVVATEGGAPSASPPPPGPLATPPRAPFARLPPRPGSG